MAEARRTVGFEKLILDDKAATVRFAEEGMRIDLGGIAKGYAVDKAVEAMQKKGALGGMVDLGGNIRCFGRVPRGQQKWRIGIQDPNVAPDELGGSEVPARSWSWETPASPRAGITDGSPVVQGAQAKPHHGYPHRQGSPQGRQ